MRLGFDMDGTICDGRYLTAPERGYERYLELAPYDRHTIQVWNDLCLAHTVYIITARSYDPHAWRHIDTWLARATMSSPAGIITHINQGDKMDLVRALKLDYYFDDSPRVYEDAMCYPEIWTYLMNNPNWPENQQYTDKLFSWKEIEQKLAINHP